MEIFATLLRELRSTRLSFLPKSKNSLLLSELKPVHRRFCELVATEMEPKAAAKALGYSGQYATQLMRNELVQEYLHELYMEIRRRTTYTRDKAVEMAFETFEIAKIQADAAGMSRALQELNKIHGYYEPEKLKIELSANAQRVMDTMEQLDDAKLLEMAALEGEYEEVVEH